MLRVLDLFSGIGGFSLGLERAGGFETAGFCERDEYCQHVLAKHWPGVPCHSDVTTREFQEGEADVVTGGFPCQDLSYAGEGAGLAGERSGLWRELVRAIRVVRPLYAIVENVAALLDRGMGVVLRDMADIGYDAEWDCISACALGATHMRRRVFIVAYPHSLDGRPRLWHPPSRPHGKVQVLDCFPGSRARALARMENPSELYRGADGLPNGSHRNRAIGNSIYPAIAALIGDAIKAAYYNDNGLKAAVADTGSEVENG